MMEPLLVRVPLHFLAALKVLIRKAESPMVTWTGDARKARKDAEALRFTRIQKALKMLEDLGTIGAEETMKKYGIDRDGIDNLENFE